MIRAILAGACLALAASTAFAAPVSPGPSSVATRTGSFVPPPSALGTVHAPVGTVVNEGYGADIALPAATLTNTDALTKVKCAAAGGCTLIVRLWGQFVASADGQAALCPMVDGNLSALGCSFLGVVKAAESYSSKTMLVTYAVAQGTHQVRAQAYLAGGGTLISYHYEYEITTP